MKFNLLSLFSGIGGFRAGIGEVRIFQYGGTVRD